MVVLTVKPLDSVYSPQVQKKRRVNMTIKEVEVRTGLARANIGN